MPVTLPDCANQLHGLPLDPILLSGCWQAEAARHAGAITAHATDLAGYLILGTGVLALSSAAAILLSARNQSRRERDAARQRRQNDVRRTAGAYLAEISSVCDYIKEVGMVGTLRDKASRRDLLRFHPGSQWLRTYRHDPSSVGLFDETLSRDIIYFYCRMWNELGRLRWMNEWKTEGVSPDEISRQQNMSADTIEKLYSEAGTIIERLKTEIEKP